MARKFEDPNRNCVNSISWSLCEERYVVEDRGDGIAELVLLDRPGALHEGKIIGWIHAVAPSPSDDYFDGSAFPGTLEEVKGLPPRPVENIEALEDFIREYHKFLAISQDASH